MRRVSYSSVLRGYLAVFRFAQIKHRASFSECCKQTASCSVTSHPNWSYLYNVWCIGVLYPVFPVEFARFFPRKKSGKSRGKYGTSDYLQEKTGEKIRFLALQTAPKLQYTLFLGTINVGTRTSPCPWPGTACPRSRPYPAFPARPSLSAHPALPAQPGRSPAT